MTERGDMTLLLNALADGELDAARALEIERAIAGDAGLRSEYETIKSLRAALNSKLPQEEIPAALREKIAGLAAPARVSAKPLPPHWRSLAASALLAAGLASAATFYAVAPDTSGATAQAVLAGHLRGLASAQPVDVASSDQHTVKPWFAGKLALSPPVVDLAASGFTLAGGRVDIVGGHAVPTLVYNDRKHTISLTIVPADRSGQGQRRLSGFSIVEWTGGEFNYWAVSDASFEELENFARAWRSAVAQ